MGCRKLSAYCRRHLGLGALLLTLAPPAVPVARAAPAAGSLSTYTYDDFSDLRAELLNRLGGCTKRAYLTTEYLTDGEIVTALYVAQYRKVDVRVLLGRAKAAFYMSRLNYLKNQNIPVFLRPDSFRPRTASSLLCDDQLLMIDGELDFMSKYKRFTLAVADAPTTEAYTRGFAAAAAMAIPANQRPLPLVGKGRNWAAPGGSTTTSSGGSGVYRPVLPQPRYDRSDGNGGYIYDRHRDPRPDGVPAKLPKELKFMLEQQRQQEMEQKALERHPPPPLPPAAAGHDAAAPQQPLGPGGASPAHGEPEAKPGAGEARDTQAPPGNPADSLIKTPVLRDDTEQGGD